jgi:hypothetical protein
MRSEESTNTILTVGNYGRETETYETEFSKSSVLEIRNFYNSYIYG